MPKKQTQTEIIEAFRAKHGDKYDYSQVEYINSNAKVKVICSTHGVFEIDVGHHKNGVGCKKCYFDSQKISKDEFVIRSQGYFGDAYDYSLFGEMPSVGEKVAIVCKEYGVFYQEPRVHMRGHTGCEKCKSLKLSGSAENKGKLKSATELKVEFIQRANMVHGGKYDYSKFEYTSADKNGIIICRQHGEFLQKPSNHLKGTQCPKCSNEERKNGTLKKECKERGVDYYRALKRRQVGLGDDKIFSTEYIRDSREINKITIYGQEYPNVREAKRILNSPADAKNNNKVD